MPRCNQPRKTWRYDEEFKVKAVQLSLLDGIQVKEVAATLRFCGDSIQNIISPNRRETINTANISSRF